MFYVMVFLELKKLNKFAILKVWLVFVVPALSKHSMIFWMIRDLEKIMFAFCYHLNRNTET